MSRKLSYFESGLSGYWAKRQNPEVVKLALQINYLTVFIIFGLLGLQVLLNLSLITVSLLFLAIISIIFLEINLKKYPLIVVPFSQLVIILTIAYLNLTIVDTLPAQNLYPNVLEILLSFVLTLWLFLELYIVRRYFFDSKALIPETKVNKEQLKTFLDQLELSQPNLDHEFSEPPKSELKDLIVHLIWVLLLICLILIPLGMFLFFKVLIYPYIVLIPSVLGTLLLILIHSRRA